MIRVATPAVREAAGAAGSVSATRRPPDVAPHPSDLLCDGVPDVVAGVDPCLIRQVVEHGERGLEAVREITRGGQCMCDPGLALVEQVIGTSSS